MVKPITLYSAAAGINTVLDPQRLLFGTMENPGLIELSQAVNVSIDDRGLVFLRNGRTIVVSGSFHSLFCDGGDCFAAKGGADDDSIIRVNADFSTSTVRAGLTKNLRVEWGQVNSDTFYSNGTQHGYIRSGVNFSWPVGTYRGPDADIDFAPTVPAPNHFAFLQNANKCALAVGSYIILNHLPFQYGLYAPAFGSIGFETNVLMLFGVQGGFFASDDKQIWFFRKLEGGWYDYRQELIATYPALEWSLAHDKVRLRDIKIELDGYCRVFATTKGICIGGDGGLFVNMTQEAVNYPSGYGSGACLVRDNTVIHTAW